MSLAPYNLEPLVTNIVGIPCLARTPQHKQELECLERQTKSVMRERGAWKLRPSPFVFLKLWDALCIFQAGFPVDRQLLGKSLSLAMPELAPISFDLLVLTPLSKDAYIPMFSPRPRVSGSPLCTTSHEPTLRPVVRQCVQRPFSHPQRQCLTLPEVAEARAKPFIALSDSSMCRTF